MTTQCGLNTATVRAHYGGKVHPGMGAGFRQMLLHVGGPNGVPMIVLDDGYRLYGRLLQVDGGAEFLIMEYKHCDIPGAAFALVDHLFREWS